MRISFPFSIGIVLLSAGIDLATKAWAVSELALYHYIPLWGHTFGLMLAQNHGVAFSFPLEGLALQVITVALIMGIFYAYFWSEPLRGHAGIDIGYALLLGGAIGNAYERLFVGHVTDFLWVRGFAIFNGADMMLTIGVGLILITHALRTLSHSHPSLP